MSNSKYGVKIRNYKVGSIYEYNLGVRDNYHFTNAMFTNSLFLYFLRENGLKEINGTTRDIIGINFDYGSKSYEEIKKITEKKIKDSKEEESKEYFKLRLENIELNKTKYDKQSKEDLRILYYKNGVDIEYPTYYKDGRLKKKEIIHYMMLYRSTGKAKEGSCIFINKKLYKRAIDFLYMGYKMPKKNSPIVEMCAYSSLVCSTIVGTFRVNPRNILILKDVDSFFETKVINIEINKDKHCIANELEKYKLKNTLFDGQCLIDDKVFPKIDECGNKHDGAVLVRHHMCKSGGHHTYMQKFFKDYYGDDYENATIKDMWGNKHYVKDIEMITTDNSMKWIKFDISYDTWCEKVNENGNMFGIVKSPHKSKLGDVQRMSYQMINSLDMDIMENVVKDSKKYIELLKADNNIFLDYLEKNKNFSNDYEVLIELCKQNCNFVRSEYFRDRKKEIIRGYINNFKFGKVLQNADNLTLVGSPYAMLLYSVGEDVEKDDTFCFEKDCIQCYTKRFKDGEYLASFRSPFNAKNNMEYFHNVYSKHIEEYFNLGNEVMAVNVIHTDVQDRGNGLDFDFDNSYTTNQEDIVEYAKYCYLNYPTIVNNIPKETKKYDYSLENYANIDNNLASAQRAIGESSNMAQLALTYTYNFNDKKYYEYVCILSVLAQVAIDNAKRKFDIDINEEIDKIKKDLDIDKNKYPSFWKHIKDKKTKKCQVKFNKKNINNKLVCPMNYLIETSFEDSRSNKETLPMSYFFNKFPLEKDRRQCKKVEDLIQKYSLCLFKSDTEDDYFLLRNDFDEMIKDISSIYISNSYLGLFSWLIDRAFLIVPQSKGKRNKSFSQTKTNKTILLNTLYNINKKNFLKCFSKNA